MPKTTNKTPHPSATASNGSTTPARRLLETQTAPAPAKIDHASCGICGHKISNQSCIGCDKCDSLVHGTQMCSGLPEKVVKNIIDYNNVGVAYICFECRKSKIATKKSTRSSSHEHDTDNSLLFNQLFETIKGLSNTVQTLFNEVKAMSQINIHSPPLDQEKIKILVTDQYHEMEERKKRRNYIVIKGLPTANLDEAADKFKTLSKYLINKEVIPHNIMKIKNVHNMFRLRIDCDEDRTNLLTSAHNLKNNENFKISISTAT